MPKLSASILSVSSLTSKIKADMFGLYSSYYESTSEKLFYNDLGHKDDVIILNDNNRNLRGFTTVELIDEEFGGQSIKVIFSGDTIIHHEYWGEQTLQNAWCEYAGKLRAEIRDQLLYWLLITKGHRTYRLLPLFAREYFPSRKANSLALQKLATYLASKKFGKIYDRKTGLVKYPVSHGHLKQEWADAEVLKGRNKEIEFFLKKNPDYDKGHELVCIAEVSESNAKSFALTGLRKGMAEVT